MYGEPGQLCSAPLTGDNASTSTPGTRPAAAAAARYYSHRHRRAGRQTPGVVQCRHATSLSHARRHACTVIPPLTTTTTPPHDGRSTTSSTHQPLLALSRHTHTHTHTPASHSTAYMQQYHTRSTQPATTTYTDTGTQYTTTTSHITATARMLYETVHAIKCGEAWTTDKRRVNFKGCLIF